MNKTKFIFVAVGFALAMTFTLSCSASAILDELTGEEVQNNIVSYQGKDYATVKIGGKTWMAENLNYAVSGSKCGVSNGSSVSDENTAICELYGRLYDWVTAMALGPHCNNSFCSTEIKFPHRGICPEGWHLPTESEWNELAQAVDVGQGPAIPLKATDGWAGNANGTNSSGFSAMPSGFGENGIFNAGYYSYWWSVDQNAARGLGDDAYARFLAWESGVNANGAPHYIERLNVNTYYKTGLYSVRCVKN